MKLEIKQYGKGTGHVGCSATIYVSGKVVAVIVFDSYKKGPFYIYGCTNEGITCSFDVSLYDEISIQEIK